MDLAETGILDPYFRTKDFADDVLFRVLGHPRLSFVDISLPKAVEWLIIHFEFGRCLLIFAGKEFPRVKVAAMEAEEELFNFWLSQSWIERLEGDYE